eukprot:9182415-Pyramimonas_sp.AAC.1
MSSLAPRDLFRHSNDDASTDHRVGISHHASPQSVTSKLCQNMHHHQSVLKTAWATTLPPSPFQWCIPCTLSPHLSGSRLVRHVGGGIYPLPSSDWYPIGPPCRCIPLTDSRQTAWLIHADGSIPPELSLIHI